MITASIVFYRTSVEDVRTVLQCAVDCRCIDKIYVIDNSLTDELRPEVMAFDTDSRISYAFGHGNIGYGSGHNIALRQSLDAGAKYHLILNPDIAFKEDAILSLVAFADAHPEIGALMPKINDFSGNQSFPLLLIPSPLDVLGKRILPQSMFKKRTERVTMCNSDLSKPRNVSQLSGCFMFLRVDTLRKVGLFDERYFMYFEDNDLERRIHKEAKTVYYPYCSIMHRAAHEHRYNRTLLRISIRSAIKYYNKWGWLFDRDRRRWNRETLSQSSFVD